MLRSIFLQPVSRRAGVSRRSANILVLGLALAGCGSSHEPSDGGDSAIGHIDGRVPSGSCAEGTALACDCPGDAVGFSYCEGGEYQPCECPVPLVDGGAAHPGPGLDGGADADGGAAPECVEEDEEWCDGSDNDCDGAVDEGHSCPDGTVAHTVPYTGPVYVQVDASDGSTYLQSIWPDRAAPVIDASESLVLRHTDGAVFQLVDGSVVQQAPATERYETPPCFAPAFYGFDGTDQIVYQCGDTLRGARGALLGTIDTTRGRLVDVLGGGGILVRLSSHDQGWGVLDRTGATLGDVPVDEWVGQLWAERNGYSVAGDHAFVAYDRTYRGSTRREVIVLRADGDSGEWRTVRRVPVGGRPVFSIPLPNGVVLAAYGAGEGNGYDVIEFPTDGPQRRIWSDRDEPDRMHRPVLFLAR